MEYVALGGPAPVPGDAFGQQGDPTVHFATTVEAMNQLGMGRRNWRVTDRNDVAWIVHRESDGRLVGVLDIENP